MTSRASGPDAQFSLDLPEDLLRPTAPIRQRSRPPEVLQRWGDQVAVTGVWPERRRAVAVIGTRAPSAGQQLCAEETGAALARLGVVVVSGGALGVDAAALRGALQAGGPAVAVLPRHPDQPYPAAHQPLYGEIVQQGGCLVGLQGLPGPMPRWAFGRRNALMVELVDAVVVVAAGLNSGTLQAVRAADRAGLPIVARCWPGDPDPSPGTRLMANAGVPALAAPGELAGWLDEIETFTLEQRVRETTALGRALAACGSEAARRGRTAAPPRGKSRGTVDGTPRRWQSYAGPQPAERAAAAADAPPLHGEEALLWAALAEFGAVGATLEPLSQAAQLPRATAAALLLNLAVAGRVRQGTDGSYVAQ